MTVTLLEGHVTDVLAGLPAGHFHTVCTSPPYAWLRAYGTEPQVWQTADGDALCAPEQHEWGEYAVPTRSGGTGEASPVARDRAAESIGYSHQPPSAAAFCVHCHAWRGELGQEPTIELYVEHLVAVFRAVGRVLRADGSLWVNIAGCFFNDPGGQNGSQGTVSPKAIEANGALGRQKRGRHPWLKPLDWVDVPGLFARAMQQDGWCWRSDVVWVKPSALPESVSGTRWERCRSRGLTLGGWRDCPGCPRCEKTDGLVLRRGSGRPTKTHEHVHLYTKGPGYFYDAEAVREPASLDSHGGGRPGQQAEHTALLGGGHRNGVDGSTLTRPGGAGGRNLRDVWTIPPEPISESHYAAFPSALPERCIKAGTSEWGCCPSCGAPWARVLQQRAAGWHESPKDAGRREQGLQSDKSGLHSQYRDAESSTLGWRPTCRCPGVAEQAPVPARVLDPFGGSGTTLLAANRLGRDATGIDLKPQYNALARKRLGREPLSLFAWRATPSSNEDTPEEVQV